MSDALDKGVLHEVVVAKLKSLERCAPTVIFDERKTVPTKLDPIARRFQNKMIL